MRVLFTFAGGSGHAEPLLPLAAAAAAAGHEVLVAGRDDALAAAEGRGLATLATEPGQGPRERTPLAPVDREHELRVVREYYAGRLAARREQAVEELCEDRRPEVLVCDEMDFGAMAAAERAGVPHAVVLVSASGDFVRDAGLEPPRGLVLSPFPPSLRADVLAFRGAEPGVAAGELVYVTLGTVFGPESGDLLPRVLAGVARLGRPVLATVGRDGDPAALGPLPAHVRVERFVPQGEVLPRCAAVVSHGGSGTLLGALAHGLPSVLLPLGADQPWNAARAEELGVARVLDAVAAGPAEVAAAVERVLAEPAPRRAAEALRDELAALPPVERALDAVLALG